MTGPAGPRRGGLLLAALVAAPALLVYRLTLMPGVGLIDSGELALAAWLPGNAHPPGSPVWLLLGFLFSRLPFGEVAFRMNLFSAAGAAAAPVAPGKQTASRNPEWSRGGKPGARIDSTGRSAAGIVTRCIGGRDTRRALAGTHRGDGRAGPGATVRGA
ncbi:MAG: DUF2723 domain-containing protein [Acidobacteria bacterium ACB2]|nr:DUF2723 domain-containing protein [Acidobacteria bacterium ACB2]